MNKLSYTPLRKSSLRTGIKLLFLLLLVFVTAACNSRLTGEVYLGDLDELTPDEELTNLVSLHLPVSGSDEEDCEEYRNRYNKVFRQSRSFKNMEYVRCHSEDSDNFAEFELSIPLRMTDPSMGTMRGPVELIRHDEENGQRAIYIRVDPKALDNLGDLIYDEFYRRLDLTDTAPEILISNDLREAQTVIISHAFVQNEPVVEPREFVLERRDDLSIVLSDVTAAWIFAKSSKLSPRYARIATWIPSE